MPVHHRARRGFSLIELLIVIAILSAVYYRLSPMISSIKARSALRATRQELTSAFASARDAALQKGRIATLSLTTSTASVTVVSSTTGNTVTLLGPLDFTQMHSTVLTALSSAPTTVSFDGRGLISPATSAIYKYRIAVSSWADTVCVNGAGIVLIRGCAL